MMATVGVVACTAATLPLQDAIFSMSVHGEEDSAVKAVMLIWTKTSQHGSRQRTRAHSKRAMACEYIRELLIESCEAA